MDEKTDKRLIVLKGSIKTPPFTDQGRSETGRYLRVLQKGEPLSMPFSRPMRSIGDDCHELRIQEEQHYWRIIYYVDSDAVVILDVFAKKTAKTPDHVIEECRKRLNGCLVRRPKENR